MNLQDLVDKIDYEGGIGSALFYFGRELASESEQLNKLWATAYDALRAIEDFLEPYEVHQL